MTTDIPALKRQLTDAGLTHGPLHDALDELERTRAERDELRAAVGRVETEKCEAIDWAKHQHRAADRYAAQLDSTLKDRTMILVERDRTFALMLARAETAEADRDRLAGELGRMRAALQNIVDSYEATSELHTSSAECAANLHDFARAALKGAKP